MAANDHVTIGAVRTLGQPGVRVPQDVALVSFDVFVGRAPPAPAPPHPGGPGTRRARR